MSEVTATVFVVDDDISVRESLELLIRMAGWQPETFESARDFLSHLRDTAPCCLVLDVTLPGLNALLHEAEMQGLRSRYTLLTPRVAKRWRWSSAVC